MSYKHCEIYKQGCENSLFTQVRVPQGFYHNAKGLLGEAQLKENTGMLFKRCSSIHMFGMKIPLDIIFLASDGRIIKCVSGLQPWKVSGCLGSSMTLELPKGSIEKTGLKQNMKLEIKECKNQE